MPYSMQLKVRFSIIVLLLGSSQSVAAQCIDTDGDGWGWDGTKSCTVTTQVTETECFDSLPLNDGWGWNGVTSCRIETTVPPPISGQNCIDSAPVGDGWGWDGVQSCRIDTTVTTPETGQVCIDSAPVGDGWGWDGVKSCRIEASGATETLERLLTKGNGSQTYASSHIAVSANAQFSVFSSFDAVVAGMDATGFSQLYLQNEQTNSASLISVDVNGNPGANHSYASAISSNGRYAVFNSYAQNLASGQTNGSDHVHRFDSATGELQLISVDSSGQQARGNSYGARVSDNGSIIAFNSDAANLDGVDDNARTDVFLHYVNSALTQRVSFAADGQSSNGDSRLLDLSADGRYLLFSSNATNLIAGSSDIGLFLYDTMADVLTNQTNARVGAAAISDDGRYLTYSINNNGETRITWFDRSTGRSRIVTTGVNGEQGTGTHPDISADGRYVVFESDSGSLTLPVTSDTQGSRNIFLADMMQEGNDNITLVSQSSDQIPSNNISQYPRFTPDGGSIYFLSAASNLVAADSNDRNDYFIAPLLR